MSEILSKVVRIDLGDEVTANDDTIVVMLHGFGATAQDLVPLAAEIGLFRRWWFPQAPYPITVMGMRYGQAWFPRDETAMETAVYGSYFTNLRSLEPRGLTESAREIALLLDESRIPPESVVLGGFSQGAMVSAEYARLCLHEGRPLPRALVLLSGALIGERLWRDGASPRPDASRRATAVPVFQSHGRSDTVLPYTEGEALREILEQTGFSVRFLPFEGGHEIPGSVVTEVRDVLGTLT